MVKKKRLAKLAIRLQYEAVLNYNNDAKAGTKELAIVILNFTGQAFWVSNLDGECIYASEALCRKLGRVESDIVYNNWASIIYENDRDRVWDTWVDFVDHNKAFNINYSFIHGVDNSELKIKGKAYKLPATGIIIGVLTNQ